MSELLLVGAGGVLGAWARYLLGQRVERRLLDTLAVNVLGSFALGALLALPATHPLSLVFAVGFCGAFTTFSTFAVETVHAVETGDRRLAVANAAVNLLGATVAVAAGATLVAVLS
ncbi:CrcB protein [Halovenus aranensis]|uniref:Fluoride-specific ion channel FluC n=1 Tax=Halovenus aranensis TaxID=890420 RepID=A0A1G8WK25_9EURY|nr:CrcB family protein [Halovenus aranensis]SDJ78423.1 CrcB protein [Halovenus aranensis]